MTCEWVQVECPECGLFTASSNLEGGVSAEGFEALEAIILVVHRKMAHPTQSAEE